MLPHLRPQQQRELEVHDLDAEKVQVSKMQEGTPDGSEHL
jgi:hypothetical protein